MTLRYLRKRFPAWTWRAERLGFGWTYDGIRGERGVRLYATAMLCGPSEDDYSTDWRVIEGDSSESLAMWAMREYAREDAA